MKKVLNKSIENVSTQFKKIGEILETKNYSLFGYVRGNRELNETNLKKIIQSFSKKKINEIAILVGYVPEDPNGKIFHILEGQHRFETCKNLKLPVSFVIYKDYNPNLMEESLGVIELLNTASKTWDVNNFMVSKATLGNESYKRYLTIKNKYPFEHEILFHTLNLKTERKKITFTEFKEGTLEFSEEDMVWLEDKLNFLSKFSKKIEESKSVSRYYYKALIDVSMLENLNVTRLVERFNSLTWELPFSRSKESCLSIIQGRYNTKDKHKIQLITDGKTSRLML
jgi:hypothetical protein